MSSLGMSEAPWPLFALGEQLAPDQHAANLAGSRADLVELGIAPQPAGGVVVGVADAAQRLDRLARHPGGLLGGIEDDAGAVLARGRAGKPAGVQRLAHRIAVGAAG